MGLKKIGSRIRRAYEKFKNRSKKVSRVRVHAYSAEVVDGNFTLSGRIYTNDHTQDLRLVIRKFREAGFLYETPIELKQVSSIIDYRKWFYWLKLRLSAYEFECKTQIPWSDLPSSTYSVEVEFLWPKRNNPLAAGKCRIRAYHEFEELLDTVDGEGNTLHVFTDETSKMLRLELFHWGKSELNSMLEYARKPRVDNGRVSCVVGEYSNTAKDNGRWFFEALKDDDLGVDPTYVIERVHQGNLDMTQPNVVEYGTVEHLKKCIDSPILAFSHSKSYIYPNVVRKIAPEQYKDVKTFWLQHGVTALKRSVVSVYKKKRANFDFVAVSSPLERDIFVDYFDYEPSNIKIAGFARYDNLFRLSQAAEREDRILVFPTWRKDLMTKSDEDFVQTEFFIEWTTAMQLIQAQTGMKVIMMVHPFLNHFQHLFEPYADEVFLSSDFQAEVVRSSCLLTDYSSVCFDAIYAGLPVAFFHFDKERYGFKKGALIDTDAQMPGPVADTSAQLADIVCEFQEQGWGMDGGKYQNLYFTNVDGDNSKRIAEVIRAAV